MPHELRNTYTSSTQTRVVASFHTDGDNGLNISDPVQSHPGLGTIVSCTTSKEIGQAAGTWSLVIKKSASFGPRSALRDLWKDPENVWVRIKFVVDGQVIDTMLGLIDSVNEDTQRTGLGQRAETYTITGRDIGKIFEMTELFVNYFHNADNPIRAQGQLTAASMENGISGTPAHFIRDVLIDEWISNHGGAEQQWALPQSLGGGFFSNILSTAGVENMDQTVNGWAIAPNLFALDQTGGKLWDVMQEYANPVMNELFIDLGFAHPNRVPSARDLRELTPVLYLRERPFPIRSDDDRTTNSTKWNQLRTHTLTLEDVRDRKIAKGGAVNRYNYWVMRLDGIGTEGFNVAEILQRGIDGVPYGRPGNIPIFNTQSIQRNGVRPYQSSTRYIPFITTGDDNDHVEDRLRSQTLNRDNIWRLVGRWLKKIHDWYSIAPRELSGKIETTRVMPEIRIGHRVVEQRAEGRITYYVEGVEHTFQYPNSGKTSLTLTRGEYDGDDLLGDIYATYDNPRALSEREACFIPLDADLTDSELDDFVRQGCTVQLPSRNFAQVLYEARLGHGNVSEGAGFTVDNADATQGAQQRSLGIEQDGNVFSQDSPDDFAASDPGMNRSLDNAEPSVGDNTAIPTPNEQGSTNQDPVLDQARLEQGHPIDSNLPFDPIEGLENAGP